MEIKKDKVIMKFSEYIDLVDRINNLNDRHDEDFKKNYQLEDILNTYKHEFKTLNKKLHDEKRKFYRNRRLFEQFIDDVLSIIDEDVLKETTNLTYKTVKEEILKKYDEDVPIECIYDDLVIDINEIKRLQQENQQLKDNWNKLKEWLSEQPIFDYFSPADIKIKIKELESSDSNE